MLVGQLLALVQGRAVAQAQSLNDTPDPSVAHHFTGNEVPPEAETTAVADGESGTAITLATPGGGLLTLELARTLRPAGPEPVPLRAGRVVMSWRAGGGRTGARLALPSRRCSTGRAEAAVRRRPTPARFRPKAQLGPG